MRLHLNGEIFRRNRSANMKSAQRDVGLTQRKIKVWRRRFDHASVFAILNDPDDLEEGTGSGLDAEAFSNGVLIGPELSASVKARPRCTGMRRVSK